VGRRVRKSDCGTILAILLKKRAGQRSDSAREILLRRRLRKHGLVSLGRREFRPKEVIVESATLGPRNIGSVQWVEGQGKLSNFEHLEGAGASGYS